MYRVTRISKVPNSTMNIMIDSPADGDAGFGQGGSFRFEPAGQDGDTHDLDEYAARVIMEDPGHKGHFKCTPALTKQKKGRAADTEQPADDESTSAAEAAGVNDGVAESADAPAASEAATEVVKKRKAGKAGAGS